MQRFAGRTGGLPAVAAGLTLCALAQVFGTIPLHAQVLAKPSAAPGLSIGSVAPDIDLPLLSGGTMTLASQRGHPVVVSFWGTWCPPCRDEFPQLVRVHREQAAAGLRVLAVNGLDQESGTKPIHKFVERYAATFPILLDEHGSMRTTYRSAGLPMTVFIDSGGVIRRINTGPITAAGLDSGVAEIVSRAH